MKGARLVLPLLTLSQWKIIESFMLVTKSRVLPRRGVAVRRSSTKVKNRDEDPAVSVYSTPGCPHCVRAKKMLTNLSIEYINVDVSEASKRRELAEKTGATSVPQIFIDDALIGGADDLQEAWELGRLASFFARPLHFTVEATKEVKKEVDVRQLHVPDGPLNVLREVSTHTPSDERDEDVASALQRVALDLIDTHVTESGVDYDALRYSAAFADFVQTAARLTELNKDPVSNLHDADYINLYNAMVLHGSVVLGHPQNPEERQSFYSQAVSYAIGPHILSLDDVEHGVLRRSRDRKGFDSNDERRYLFAQTPHFDPRIHFALNCGARSCPPIKLFTQQNLDSELQAAAHAFLDAETTVKGNIVTLSRLFFWYAIDFLTVASEDAHSGDTLLDPRAEQLNSSEFWADEEAVSATYGHKLIRAAASLASPRLSAQLNELLSASSGPHPVTTLSFAPYDWSRNDNS